MREAFSKLKNYTRDKLVDPPYWIYSLEAQKPSVTDGKGSFMYLPPEIRLKVRRSLMCRT